MHEILRGTYDSDYGKQSERYGQIASVTVVQTTAHTTGNMLGNIHTATAATAARILGLSYTAIEYDRIYDLYDCGGNIFL